MDSKTSILYVDDEPINLMLFELNFKSKYHVITANNAKEGLHVLEKNPHIPIVISDMKMPEVNGVDFLRSVKEQFPQCSCFILTGFDITPEIQKALREHIILKYLSKPFVIHEINTAIQSALN
ncbi:MAG TPA: response regulator [Bacteroidales bacterium]|nr:MAG: Hydrogenase transcriptional regulatory protein hupR1 [Bacteroidetes bacterium ADurb.Bin217]HPM13317.1 response regulator [Bacteroidales bacterium]